MTIQDYPMSSSFNRISREWHRFLRRPMEGISLGPFADDMWHWEAIILGMSGTPFEGGTFVLEITFPDKYPLVPPKVRFKTPVYHPNIDSNGEISIDVLRATWSPALNVQQVLLAIRLMLDDPNPDDNLVPEIAEVCKNDYAKYERTVREWTQKYAM